MNNVGNNLMNTPTTAERNSTISRSVPRGSTQRPDAGGREGQTAREKGEIEQNSLTDRFSFYLFSIMIPFHYPIMYVHTERKRYDFRMTPLGLCARLRSADELPMNTVHKCAHKCLAKTNFVDTEAQCTARRLTMARMAPFKSGHYSKPHRNHYFIAYFSDS